MPESNPVNPILSPASAGITAFKSLEFVPEMVLPQPVSEAHRLLLWQASQYGTCFPEAQIVNYLSAGSNPIIATNYKERRPIVMAARNDLKADNLLVTGNNPYGFRVFGSRSAVPQSRLIELSQFGLQITAESARRVMHDRLRNPMTRRAAEATYARCIYRLISPTVKYLPGPKFM